MFFWLRRGIRPAFWRRRAQVSRTPYACFERLIETEDAFLLIFDKRAAVLHKQDLADADAGDFRNFMAARTALVAAL